LLVNRGDEVAMTTTKVVPGMLIAVPSAEDVAREASTRIAKTLREAVKTRGKATIALSGGDTPRQTYTRLADEPDLDWGAVEVFFVDERAVAPTDDRSNYRWAKECLLDRAKIPAGHVHRMPADEADLEGAAREYEQVVRSGVPVGQGGLPSFDAMVLGVGDDGHTASLFPGMPTVDITDRVVVAVGKTEGREERLTVTAPVIEQSRAVFVLAVGAKKTAALERVWAVSGSLRDTPARVIRNVRGSIHWIIDKAAGGM
jgi:6-phosphogluconolactonase